MHLLYAQCITCMCICRCVYARVYVRMRMYMHVYVYVYIYMLICRLAHVFVCMYVYIYNSKYIKINSFNTIIKLNYYRSTTLAEHLITIYFV